MPTLTTRIHSNYRRQPIAGRAKLPPWFILVIKAFLQLLLFDLFLARGDFAKLYDRVRTYPTGKSDAPEFLERICAAVDLASICYWKQILCLQRSAATACLLKSFGVPAQMLIGVQLLPFKAHAWVEVAGRVVSDKPYMREMYEVLDRC